MLLDSHTLGSLFNYCEFETEVTLSSGQKSDWYCDVKSFLLVEGDRIGRLMANQCLYIWMEHCTKTRNTDFIVYPLPPQVLGIGYGGAILVGGLAAKGCSGVVIRQDKKDHGLKNTPIGDTDFKEVIIVEDVVTTGGSVLKAIQVAEDLGMKVIGVVAVVNRISDADTDLESVKALEKYNFSSLVTEKEIKQAKFGFSDLDK